MTRYARALQTGHMRHTFSHHTITLSLELHFVALRLACQVDQEEDKIRLWTAQAPWVMGLPDPR